MNAKQELEYIRRAEIDESADRYYIITETVEKYTRTASGKSWSRQPIESRTEEIPARYYINGTHPDTIRFFRNLGGRETVRRAYTFAGFIPVEIISVSPDGAEKTRRAYKFTKRPQA